MCWERASEAEGGGDGEGGWERQGRDLGALDSRKLRLWCVGGIGSLILVKGKWASMWGLLRWRGGARQQTRSRGHRNVGTMAAHTCTQSSELLVELTSSRGRRSLGRVRSPRTPLPADLQGCLVLFALMFFLFGMLF